MQTVNGMHEFQLREKDFIHPQSCMDVVNGVVILH